ncbi:asparagine synthetase B family protein [Pseudoxanthomonas dokdonensis]|uniref:asparagine synthase (glutamine-hydrolyzing) n=1 Tax=Pseudoxanthomonas dokdonensis TaxID=344882 RepID=A0A0R0CSC2_9GAMM|nr:asparagine synthase C-terminal domain-containing protein [Pseudoxanthomonas dokdonensis]KRG68951.1 hypothetical protein ABB29_10860 [Pseudoxanthomonas dokdonensis]
MNPADSIRGDFIVAAGPRAYEWLSQLGGFDVHKAGPSLWLATRGAVLRGNNAQGMTWAALADLIEGDVGAVELDDDSFPQRHWRGRFAHAMWSADSNRIQLLTDHFSSVPLYWYQRDGHHAVASDLRLLLDAPGVRREPDLRAVYHYLNFTCIPAPLTICSDIQKVEPGTRLSLDGSRHSSVRYYLPEYPEDLQGSDEALADELRQRIVASVQAFRPHSDAGWGCFLSGGTDSSSIVSILARQQLSPVHSCSIGFREAGYDELDFARLAGEACGARTHLAQVDQTRALALLDTVVEAYDQPFGNASAVPTLACAELGHAQGFSLMLGGDGGDEVFGGNQRYAKDRVMQGFHDLPSPLKKAASAVGEWVGGGNNHLLNRVRNFTRRGSLPNPDRFYTDDSFASDYYTELLTPQLRQQVPQEASLEAMRQIYNLGAPAAPLHRIMRLDLLMAIAQNDLVKVHRACRQHGVSARFPLLDTQLVDFCGRLAARYKVRGLKKRYLFKQAMASILPAEILSKRKQGFGLPIAIWMKDDPALQARVRDVLLDERTRERGWINPEFVSALVRMHMDGGWDHSNAIWQLLILELWMRRYMDAK